MISNHAAKTEVVLTQIIRRVEVTVQEGGGGTHQITVGSHPGSVPWSALTSVPANLCLATVTEDRLSIEFRDLAGNLISKAPYLP
ncbi:hypothetical protein EI77_04296 [Prosthecobacter fusiformis]|uniref:Uncharacterized protein n=1 Tax=Prosthecobacter fusiformis TaxID=48464 RepID=A0A4R7RKP4_9BACT|nr:hypothetical protein [Prosthecobacter fusiformis]TDU64112.1 hypothetical protein EI77_04296 [Prosthecobacter fusiformis]